MTSYERLSLVISFFGVLVSAIVLILLLKQLGLLSRQVSDAREALEDSRRVTEKENARLARQATFDFVASTTTKVHELARQLPPSGSSASEFETFLNLVRVRGSKEFFVLRDYLNVTENLLAGVNMGVFDIDVVNRASGARILKTWENWGDWIVEERTAASQDTLWSELEKGAAKIRVLRRSQPAP